MANAVYDLGREGILDRTIDATGDVRCMLVLSTYTFSQAHKFVSDLGAVDNGRSAALANKTFLTGVLDSDDTSLVATAASTCKALVVYQHTGTDVTARLMAYIDTPTSGLPFTPSAGQTVTVGWDNGANKIFKL